MRADTQSITLNEDWRKVFAFVADPSNLSRWAFHFCKAVEPEGNSWRVDTPAGPVRLRCLADQSTGTIDFHLSPAPGVEFAAVSRVVPNGDGAEYVFTQFQAPDMPDHAFESQARALGEELLRLKELVEQ